jgi:hypothetical protein
MGQTRRFVLQLTTSGLPPTADITHRDHHFRKVPEAALHLQSARRVSPCPPGHFAVGSHHLVL